MISIHTLITNDKDIRHLASAIVYQFQRNRWVIFVTTDDTDILSRQEELFEIFALQCSNPQWANDFYRELTRLKPPIEYYREKENYSETQKEFGEIIKKTLNITLIE